MDGLMDGLRQRVQSEDQLIRTQNSTDDQELKQLEDTATEAFLNNDNNCFNSPLTRTSRVSRHQNSQKH